MTTTRVEVFYLYDDGTWETGFAEVPFEVAKTESQDAFTEWVYGPSGEAFRNKWYPGTVSVGIFNWSSNNE